MTYIYAFDHQHQPGDICSRAHCEAARRKPVLHGDVVAADIPMRVIRAATPDEYMNQLYDCKHIYEIEVLD